jgi:xylulokinase
MMGERTPHLDAQARGGWIGITAKNTRADLIRAVIEGVSYSQKDTLEIVEELGIRVESVRASGGGARSPFWRQILADVFAKPVATLETQEGSAYGAALLAMVGTGEFASVPEACSVTIREAHSIDPRSAEAELYAKAYGTYRALYPALRPIFPDM